MISKVGILLLFLFALNCQAESPCSVVPPKKLLFNQVCIKLKEPVSPLPIDLFPGEKLHIIVFEKSPWEKVSFDVTRTEIEDESKKQFETLSKFVIKLLPGLSSVSILKKVDPKLGGALPKEQKERAEQRASIPEPYRTSIEDLEETQKEEIRNLIQFQTTLQGLAKRTNNLIKDPKSGEFEGTLNSLSKELAETLLLIAPSLVDSSSRIGTLRGLMALPSFVFLATPQNQAAIQKVLSEILKNEELLEKELADILEAQSSLRFFLSLFNTVKNEKGSWFAQTYDLTEPANRQAEIEVSFVDRSSSKSDAKKLATIKATWKKAPAITTSLGFAFSSVAKKTYPINVTRPSPSSAIPDSLTYKIGETVVQPVIFPLMLLHYRLTKASHRDWSFHASGGAGVDVSGDSPTGELAGGLSIRFRNLYLSPLIHAARRNRLQTNFQVNDPVPSDSFVPPTQGFWDKGFAISLTYKLPF